MAGEIDPSKPHYQWPRGRDRIDTEAADAKTLGKSYVLWGVRQGLDEPDGRNRKH